MIKGIIFDMDGVISDTQKFHAQVESELLAGCGIHLTSAEITKRYAGVRTADFFKELLETQSEKYDAEALAGKKQEMMEKLASISVDAIDGSIDLIKRLYSEGYVLAVASASNLNYVQKVLNKLEIINYFSFVASGDMVASGKPSPEIFLLAASKINIIPGECLVIEDGINGMEAAKRAGMQCIGLAADKGKNYPTKNLVISLSEVTADLLNTI